MTDHLINVITEKDFDKICRTCLEFGKVSSIFQAFVENMKATDLLEFGVKIRVTENDLLPQNICDGCLTDLYRMYEFKKHCQQNEALLQSLVQCGDNSSLDENGPQEEDPLTSEGDDIQIITEQETASPRLYTCRKCDEMYPTGEDFKKHQIKSKHKSRHPKQCEVCGMYVTNITIHMRRHTKDKPFKCDICLKSFSLKRNLQRHEMSHTGERPHVCSLCGKGFIQAVSLQDHEKRHGKVRCIEKLDCKYCGRHFKRRNAFNVHVQRHKDEISEGPVTINKSQYHCKTCPASFQTRASLYQHLKIHNKNFLCNICGRAFSTNFAMKMHTATHSEDRPYTCLVCKKTFKRATGLSLHILSHTGEKPYRCRFCTQTFRQSAHLNYHERTHTGEKPHGCPFCEKRFGSSGMLHVHVRIHTGERPYVCPVCEKGFCDSSSLKRHRRRAHMKDDEEVEVESLDIDKESAELV